MWGFVSPSSLKFKAKVLSAHHSKLLSRESETGAGHSWKLNNSFPQRKLSLPVRVSRHTHGTLQSPGFLSEEGRTSERGTSPWELEDLEKAETGPGPSKPLGTSPLRRYLGSGAFLHTLCHCLHWEQELLTAQATEANTGRTTGNY